MLPFLDIQGVNLPFNSSPDLGPNRLYQSEITTHKRVIDSSQSLGGTPQIVTKIFLDQTFLPIDGGISVVRLLQKPEVELDTQKMALNVVGWQVSAPFQNIDELPRLMAKRFLVLMSLADRKLLSSEDARAFTSILSQVDYRQFSVDRSPPHYLEGRLVRKTPICYIEWHDDVKRKLSFSLIGRLDLIDPGESFSAYAKLGINNEILSLERVLPLPSV